MEEVSSGEDNNKKIVAVELAWTYHTNEHTLAYLSLDYFVNWVELYLVIQRFQLKYPVGKQERTF